MNENEAGAQEFAVELDAEQARQLREIAAAWGQTPEQALAGLVFNELTALERGGAARPASQ